MKKEIIIPSRLHLDDECGMTELTSLKANSLPMLDMKKQIKVLSLFNGMSTGTLALTQLGYDVTCYSSELLSNKAAIKVTEANFPGTVQLGDITQLRYEDGKLYSETGIYECGVFDMVLSGSPCTDMSIAGKRAGINGKCSGLFYDFIRILNEVRIDNPNVLFFQENVAKGVDPKDILAISKSLNILPVRIDSQLVGPALRDRYYWSNIKVREDWTGERFTDIPQPEDKKILLQDILTEAGHAEREKSVALLERQYIGCAYADEFSDIAQVYYRKRYARMMLQIIHLDSGLVRLFNKEELCALQTFPDNYCDCLTRNQAASVLGNGWTLEVIKHIFSFIEL